jgi:F-type H+-transporting ATPase subunit b
MKSDYEKRLADTEAKAREQIQTQIREAQDLRKNLMSEASAKADELVRRAQEEIAGERAKALADIRLQVTNLSLLAAERILGESVDTDKNRRLIDEFIEKAEVPGA